MVLGLPASASERDHVLSYLRGGSATQWEGFSWMLLNLSEFIFLR